MTVTCNIFSNLFQPYLIVGVLILMYQYSDTYRMQVINFLVYFVSVSYLCALLKFSFAQPRPFWINSDIRNLEWTCYLDYGYPSGHTMLPILIIEFLVKIIFDKYSLLHRFWKATIVVLALALYVGVFFSRLYLGQHSIMQTFYGLFWGLLFLLIQKICLEKQITRYIRHLEEQNEYKNRAKNVVVLTFAIVICVGLPIMVYFLQENYNGSLNRQIPLWSILIKERCQLDELKLYKSFNSKSLTDCSIGVVPPMIFLFILLSYLPLYYKADYRFILLEYQQLLLNLAIIIISCAPLALILIPVHSVWFLYPVQIFAFSLSIGNLMIFSSHLVKGRRFFQVLITEIKTEPNSRDNNGSSPQYPSISLSQINKENLKISINESDE